MTSQVLMIIAVVVIMLIGLAGTFLPVLPGIPVIFLAMGAYGWYEGFQVITPRYLVFMGALTVLSVVVDYLSSTLGAKWTGSGRAGVWGAFIGMIAGVFFFPPLGILIGPWLGAVIGEYIDKQDMAQAMKAGLGTVVGLFSGIVFKVMLAVIMIISFLVVVI